MKTVHEVAALAGVAASTLRYYDEIELLKPRARSSAGYRLYEREELARLREIVIWRELGFPLAQIARLLDDPSHDRLAALDRQLELAGAHLERLRRITTGLEKAIAAVRQGRSLSEDEILTAFASAEANGPDAARRRTEGTEAKSVARFAVLNGHSHAATRDDPDGEDLPARICATDPLRLAEALLALGILPVGTGTYEDRFTQEPGAWPWSPLIESCVRGRIHDVGHYGSDVRRIEASRPELIFDLLVGSTGVNLAQHVSDGHFDLEALEQVAPTRLIDIEPGAVPGFTAWLPQVGEALGCRAEAEALLASWAARTGVLRAHLEGREVAAVSCWGDELTSPTPLHPGQVLTSVGLVLAPVSGRESSNGSAVFFDEDAIGDLDAPTLFLNTRYLAREQVRRLLSDKLAGQLSAVRAGRVVDLGMEFISSGWFGAHWQLQLIARAYGLALLRAGDDADAVYAAVDPSSGLVSVAAPRADGTLSLGGPYLPARPVAVEREHATTLRLDPACAAHIARFPEAYAARGADGTELAFAPDRESALERIARRADRRAFSTPRRGREPKLQRPPRARQPH